MGALGETTLIQARNDFVQGFHDEPSDDTLPSVNVVPEPDCLAKIQAGKLHFQASIRYRGDYLPETSEPYETSIHLKARYTPPPLPGLSEYRWTKVGPPEENRET